MVADVTAQKLAEEAQRTSEERLRMAQWAAHIGIFDLNIRTGVDIWTPETEALYGLPPGGFAGTLTAFENLIHPDDRKRIIELTREMMRTGQPAEAEWRAVWPDGSVHWIAGRGQVLMDESGEPTRMLGVNMDITERKRAEEALSGMTRKLVEAQEQERVRIARELHDDISQRLALLAIEVDRVRGNYSYLPSEVRNHMQELQQMTADISSRVYAISHELHSLTPDPSNLAKSMRGWCRDFGKRQNMEISFKVHDLPRLPQGISLCLFRVLQEALYNSAKHSGVKRVEVQLAENSGNIDLVVSDSGTGFDIEAARQSEGLGLTSMQERVRLVGGTIAIDSKPLAGTTIYVRVPFKVDLIKKTTPPAQ
jgi:PAS domain S-box-containing protein